MGILLFTASLLGVVGSADPLVHVLTVEGSGERNSCSIRATACRRGNRQWDPLVHSHTTEGGG